MNLGFRISLSDEELLKQCEVSTFRSGGKGGQHVNKTESAVRMKHLSTGIITVCQDERSQYLNKKRCLENLRLKLIQRNKKKEPRIPTQMPSSAKRKRRNEKSVRSGKKQFRKKPSIEE
jgi:protein subunit release factor B